jgi:23S rRNA (pseudouridine1915-N3)-methyltransferase
MKITLFCVGKTDDSYLQEGISKYASRLKHYIKFSIVEIPDLKNTKNLSFEQQKNKEAELIMKQISATDYVVLLDDKGKEYTSKAFSEFLNQGMIKSIGSMVFIIGGPYGFDEQIYQRADMKLSLSKMTFSHQMVRLFFTEQLYRSFTILRNEPYHHE